MKTKELKELHNKTKEELESQLSSLRTKQTELLVAEVSGKEKNVKVFKNLRRDIAQILSIIAEPRKEEKK